MGYDTDDHINSSRVLESDVLIYTYLVLGIFSYCYLVVFSYPLFMIVLNHVVN